MNNKKLIKWLLVGLPALGLVACSSTPDYYAETPTGPGMSQEIVEGEVVTSGVEGNPSLQGDGYYNEQLLDQVVYYFDFDRSSIHADDFDALGAHASYIANNPDISVVIEGHTDPVGSPDYNDALGERRALAIEQALINDGVSPNQIRIVSYGERVPAVDGDDDRAYSLNRRAVIVYEDN